MSPEKKKTAVIFLGAQAFPKAPNYVSSESFLRSFQAVYQYCTSDDGLGIDSSLVLNLFDSDDSPNEMDEQIGNFIQQKRSGNSIGRLLIYYTGHGGYASLGGNYLLAVRSSRSNNLAVSSITFRTLATTIDKVAQGVEVFFILDCCFAGSAVFQGEGLAVSIHDDFLPGGVAFLCASSKKEVALIPEGKELTMFTEGLMKTLKTGSSAIDRPFLTLREIQQITFNHIQLQNLGEHVKPEVHSPSQPGRDIAEFPLFPNKGYQQADTYTKDIISRMDEIEAKVLNRDLSAACKLFMDFVKDFDRLRKFRKEMILTATECNELISEYENRVVDGEAYKERRQSRFADILDIGYKVLNDVSFPQE